MFDKLPIDPLYFLIGLFLGILYNYLEDPEPEVIYKYPTPDNAGKIIYQDKAGVCYKYKSKKVDCPLDKDKMSRQPVQI